MLYLSSYALFKESLELGVATGSMPPAFVKPQIEDDTVLALEPVDIFDSGELDLLLASHTASWCLLDAVEREVAIGARNVPFGVLRSTYPGVDGDCLKEFFVRLYQRGLLRLDGRPGLDPRFVENGAFFNEAKLVEVLITQKCNLGCPYCLAEAGPDMPHMHADVALRAVDEAFQLPNDGPLAIQLSGGEPFANFKLFKSVIQYIEEKKRQTGRNVVVCTQSNGTLIDDEIAEFIKAHGIQIGISTDGPGHLHNLSRPMLGGAPSHEKCLRGMQTLRRHGVRFGTILVLNRSNVGHPEEIADYFVELGSRSTKINPINMIGDAQRSWDAVAITSDEYFEFLRRFIDHVIEAKLPLSEFNLSEYLKYLVRRVHDYRCMRSNCGAGESFFLIDSKGDVYPCAHSAGISEWRLGSVHEAAGNLVALGKHNPIIQQFRERLVERMHDTRTCPWRHFCEGGCAVNAYQKFGTILARDALCSFYELIYPRFLELLASAPDRFQALLDAMFGEGQVVVVSFQLDASAARFRAACERTGSPVSMSHHFSQAERARDSAG
jgi:radical SAM protein with 4Fe4S-binding SPASM domain